MNIFDKLFCNHRHSINTHPQCFSVGNVNPGQAEKIYAEYGKPWYQIEGLKIGYLDIETDNLHPDFGTVLSWCIKEREGKTTGDVVTKEELFNGITDQRIVKSCIDEMNKYKILVTYYGTIFDITFMRAKALHYSMNFPGYEFDEYEKRDGTLTTKATPTVYHFDLYYTAKSKLASLSSKSLANVCDYLGISGKTPLEKEYWRRGKYGDPESLNKIVEHNIGDVEILEQLHNRLTPFAIFTRKSI